MTPATLMTMACAVLTGINANCLSAYNVPDPLPAHLDKPQLVTSSRLLKSGESILFKFYLPPNSPGSSFTIYSCYLETNRPSRQSVADSNLSWLDTAKGATKPLAFSNGTSQYLFTPARCGNYLAKWTIGKDVLYRYFSVIDDSYTVLRLSTHWDPDPQPSFHSVGIPIDYRLSPDQYEPNNTLYQKYLSYHRVYGETILPHLPDTPDLTFDQRFKTYKDLLDKVPHHFPDPQQARSVRLEAKWLAQDPGYPRVLQALGVNNHDGLFESNAKPWLGMPEFPYFSSPDDSRKVSQDSNSKVVAHQWDFCGGWHFLGPASWHYIVSHADFAKTRPCLDQGVKEASNLAQLSGHPAFLFPLYDAFLPEMPYPDNGFSAGVGQKQMHDYMLEYVYYMALELPARHKLVFARSADIADYHLRHFTKTPQTVFVSKTQHLDYDSWWQCFWSNKHLPLTRDSLPWTTKVSTAFALRDAYEFKDPLSREYIVFEDQHASVRFEHACPNPLWWFDYTTPARTEKGSIIQYTKTPDVDITAPLWQTRGDSITTDLKLKTSRTFDNYAIALWNIPAKYRADKSTVSTNAKDFVLVKNTDGDFHMILRFDLKPQMDLTVSIKN